MNVLIVDDDPFVLRSCRRILEDAGIPPLTAKSAESAQVLLKKNRVDLILTDIKMQGMDGFEMIRRIKKIQPDIPILMMTGYLTEDTIKKGHRTGADNYIAKPFTPQELLMAVQQTCLTLKE